MKKDNKISFSDLIVILELNRKEAKDKFSQEKNFLLQRKELKQAIDSVRKRKSIDYKHLNKLIKEYKDSRLSSKDRLRKTTKNKYQEIKEYVNQRLNLDDIALIRQVCALSRAWEHSLIRYVLTNRMAKPIFLPKVQLIDAPYRCDRKLIIEVYGNNNLGDVQKIWGLIESNQKHLLDYRIKGQRFKPHLESHKQIYKWWLEDIRGEKLAEKVRTEIGWTKFSSESLRKIIERIKELETKKIN